MTLQIGMVGSEGIVVVGDTWQYVEPKDRPWRGYHASKIRVSDDKRIAVFGAHDMRASFSIADEIITRLSDPTANRRVGILDIANRLAEGKDSQCLAAFSDPYPQLYRLSHARDGEAMCDEILSCISIGDEWNLANYWTARFYAMNLSCQQLSRLGSLVVASGARFSSATIGGLEGITCTKDGVRLWQREECQNLEADTKDLENKIGESILTA